MVMGKAQQPQQQQATGTVAKTPQYFVRTYTVGPGQMVEDGPMMRYGVALASINPLWGLGFVQISLDNGPYLPISLLPIRQPFEYVTLYNTHPNTTFTVTLVYTLTPEAEILGEYNYVYQQFNQELTITASFSGTSSGNLGPYYIGTRSIVRVIVSGTVTSTATGYLGQVQVTLFNSDQSGNQYDSWILGIIAQPYSSNWLLGPQSIDATIDGSLLNPYILLNFLLSTYTSVSLNITIVAR